MGYDEFFNLFVYYQLSQRLVGECSVIADDSQVLDSALCESVHDLQRGSDAQKSADHDGHAVLNIRNGLLQCYFLFHQR